MLLHSIYSAILRHNWIGEPVHFPMHNSSSYDGIFGFLRTGGNPVDLGIVDVVPSGTVISSNSMGDVKQVLDLESWPKLRWVSVQRNNEYLMFDFKFLRVAVEAYSIRCSSSTENQPRNWVLEGSFNSKKWFELHSVTDFNETKGFTASQSNFELPSQSRRFRYLRIRVTGLGTFGNHYLILSGVEFFGSVWSSLTTDSLYISHRLARAFACHFLFN